MIMKFYDAKKNWRKIEPHLTDKKLQDILFRDFNKFLHHSGKRFVRGQSLAEFAGDVEWNVFCRPGRRARYWDYVKFGACHWLANFNLRLAMLVAPEEPWRIVISPKHSTVWNGSNLIFDLNSQALNSTAIDAFAYAHEGGHVYLEPGEYRRCGIPGRRRS
jgi:hypothetical protein